MPVEATTIGHEENNRRHQVFIMKPFTNRPTIKRVKKTYIYIYLHVHIHSLLQELMKYISCN